MSLKFYPAKHNSLFIWIWQHLSSWELKTKVKLKINPKEIQMLRLLPSDHSLILVSNHSDELDPRICMELSRLTSRRFTFMANSEIFREWFGIARWCLQYIGAFSLERGVADQAARRYAINTIKNTNHVLVIFPEGEIYNLNDSIQPFKTGAVHLGLEAIEELYSSTSDKTVSILPIAIKYRYKRNIAFALKKRIMKMEKHLSMHIHSSDMRNELYQIMSRLATSKLDIKTSKELANLLQDTREEIISEMEKKYIGPDSLPGDLLERAQKIVVFLREQMSQKKFFTKETRKQLERDLQEVKKTIQMATWQPQYIESNPSQERLAETVIKLERIVFNIKRPALFGKREALVKILEPINLNALRATYEEEARNTAQKISENLHHKIQEAVLQI